MDCFRGLWQRYRQRQSEGHTAHKWAGALEAQASAHGLNDAFAYFQIEDFK